MATIMVRPSRVISATCRSTSTTTPAGISPPTAVNLPTSWKRSCKKRSLALRFFRHQACAHLSRSRQGVLVDSPRFHRSHSVTTPLSLGATEVHFRSPRRELHRLGELVCVAHGGLSRTSCVNQFPHCSCIETMDQEWTSSGLAQSCTVRSSFKIRSIH